MKQTDLEKEQHEAKKKQIDKDVLKAREQSYFSSTQFGRRFVSQWTTDFADALAEATERPLGKQVKTNFALTYQEFAYVLNLLTPWKVAVVALKSMLDCFGRCEWNKPKQQEAASYIGRNLENEVRHAFNERMLPKEVVEAENRELHTKGSHPRFRRKGAIKVVEYMLDELGWDKDQRFPEWSPDEKTRFGLFVIDVAIEQGLITSKPVYVRPNYSPRFLDLSSAVWARFNHFQEVLKGYSYKDWPLAEPPREWEKLDCLDRDNCSGGYLTEWMREPLCRGRIYDSDFSVDAINLLNVLGRTAWNIDADMYNVAKTCMLHEVPIGSFRVVVHDPELKHNKPEHLIGRPRTDPEVREWNAKRRVKHEELSKAVSRATRSRDVISLTDVFWKRARFYLSWSCDYRGRMYPQQSLLQPQSSDFERSMLTFADGCKLDDRGEIWAAQAVGAAMVGSKVAYQHRTTWTYDNKELIKAIAQNPIGMSSHWEGADEPWQFLQLAREWYQVVLTREKHLWNVPIGADSTSSGLQLLSAMNRDQTGMKFSNLYPVEHHDSDPLDGYIEVLRIASELASKEEKTEHLVEYLTPDYRKIGKNILMTSLYGAKEWGHWRDLRSFFGEKKLYPNHISFEDIVSIQDLVLKAGKQVFPSAYKTLAWFKRLVKAAQDNGSEALTWRTPNNDLIHLIEYKYGKIVIRTSHCGDCTIATGEKKSIKKKKIANALAASFIHSYDSCVLKTAFKGWDAPIALIHDCLKVLPNDMDEALDRIKKGFVEVCDGDPLARLADDLGVSSDQVRRLKQGSGNLLAVRYSDYMFN